MTIVEEPRAATPAPRRRPSATRTPLSRLAPKAASPWTGRAVFLVAAVALFALPGLLGDPTRVRQWAEYLCYAMVAVGIDVAWGYGGMLVLGQGVFFGIGAYAMGMHLSLEQVPEGALPQFMSLYSDYTELPALWRPFRHLWFAAPAAVLVPMVVAGLLGWLVFNRRIRGPFFAILTQATALIFWLLLVGQLKLTAGTNGLTNFSTIFGRNKYEPGTNDFLYWLAAGALLVVVALGWQLVRSRFGRLLVATRDGEDRVRFLGYDPAVLKMVAFVAAAGMAGLAGALAAPIIGIVAPNQFAVLPSILMVTWVAIGGRGTLVGAVLGALLVGWGKTAFSESRPEDWLYLQGALFVVVVAYAPGGLLGLLRSAGATVLARLRRRPPAEA
ncbi:MAG: urea ABC transporter permease subunit UrtC, partial [Actinomycetota bacterium]|nr:urea ABC transporter permease subunit UrtC [Actinomycetota bacterium]